MLISSGFVVSLGIIAAGCWALARIRPQRAGVSPPHVMLSFGLGGMLIGLWIDTAQLGWLQLAGLCRANSQISYIDSLILHLRFCLPCISVWWLVVCLRYQRYVHYIRAAAAISAL